MAYYDSFTKKPHSKRDDWRDDEQTRRPARDGDQAAPAGRSRYGEHRDDLVQTIPLAQLPGAETLEPGQKVMLSGMDGRPFPAQVVEKDDTTITFDLNHEMAGKALNFEITLLEVED